MASFKQAKAEALLFYKHWKRKPTYSPAFKAFILVTNLGWYHIVGSKSSRKRSPADVIRRLRVLSAAKHILETSTTIQDIRIKNGFTFYSLEAVVPVEINGVTFVRKVRVVLIEGESKAKTFLSVMPRK